MGFLKNIFKKKKIGYEKTLEKQLLGDIEIKKEKKNKMKVEKTLKKFRKNYKKTVKKNKSEVDVITFESDKHFKRTLTDKRGFGFQDLKKKPRKIITTLITEGYDLVFTPVIDSEVDFKIKVSAKV